MNLTQLTLAILLISGTMMGLTVFYTGIAVDNGLAYTQFSNTTNAYEKVYNLTSNMKNITAGDQNTAISTSYDTPGANSGWRVLMLYFALPNILLSMGNDLASNSSGLIPSWLGGIIMCILTLFVVMAIVNAIMGRTRV